MAFAGTGFCTVAPRGSSAALLSRKARAHVRPRLICSTLRAGGSSFQPLMHSPHAIQVGATNLRKTLLRGLKFSFVSYLARSAGGLLASFFFFLPFCWASHLSFAGALVLGFILLLFCCFIADLLLDHTLLAQDLPEDSSGVLSGRSLGAHQR